MNKVKLIVDFSFSVAVEVEDRNDHSEIARNARQELIDRINSDSIAECITYIQNDDDE